MIRGLLIAGLLGGCNMVLGLESAERELPDSDEDGVEDSRDNCPGEPNSEQVDTDRDRKGDVCDSCPLSLPTRDLDRDGIDDACDPCSLGPSHDEDGDSIFDACDVCPGDADVAQEDKDGDAIGDVCDPVLLVPNERVAFDALAPARAEWTSPLPWERTEAGESLGAPASTSEAPTLVNPALRLDGARPNVVAGFRFTGEPGAKVFVGLRTDTGDLECGVTCTATCVLYLRADGAVTTDTTKIPSGVIKLSLSVEQDGGLNGDSMACQVGGDVRASLSVQSFFNLDRPPPVIGATRGIDLRWVDVFQ